jgi:hypothetical protein
MAIISLLPIVATLSLQTRSNYEVPASTSRLLQSSGFVKNVGGLLRHIRDFGPSIDFSCVRSNPLSVLMFEMSGRQLTNERTFGTRGVFAGSAATDQWLRSRPKRALKFPFFGDDHWAEVDEFGVNILGVGYFHHFFLSIRDNVKRDKTTRAFIPIDRDHSVDLPLAEVVFRNMIAQFIAQEDLIGSSQVHIGTEHYSAFEFGQLLSYYRQAMSRPTTRWIKLSDWARNHDVAVTYGDMTAEYVYRGERYLLPLASDQFKKGTAWFKTSGPILMRGDDWLIPTAMVD